MKEKKIKVLIIEDEKEVSELYKLKLTIDDYDVITATSGQEGLKKAFKDSPDLIFLDISIYFQNQFGLRFNNHEFK